MTGGRDGRVVLAAALGLVAVLLVPVAVTAPWATRLASDTDRYVTAVSPIADDPQVRAAIEDLVVAEVVGQIDLAALADALDEGLANRAGVRLPGGIVDEAALRRWVTAVVRRLTTRFVEGPQFPAVWEAANRTVHAELVRILTAETPAEQAGTVHLSLRPVVDAVNADLGPLGLALGAAVSRLQVDIPLLTPTQVERARAGYAWISIAADWAAAAAVVLAALALLLARRRATALVWLAGGAFAMTGLLWLGLRAVRASALGSLTTEGATIADPLWTALTAPLDARMTVVLVGSAVLGFVGLVLAALSAHRPSG